MIVDFANKIRNKYFSKYKDMILIKSNISVNKETASCSFDVEYSAEEPAKEATNEEEEAAKKAIETAKKAKEAIEAANKAKG